jgi:hypothetical protein
MKPNPITDIKNAKHMSVDETLESFTPSIWTVVGIGLAGVMLGVSLGWYLAGGVKIEEHYFASREAREPSPDNPAFTMDKSVDVDLTGVPEEVSD